MCPAVLYINGPEHWSEAWPPLAGQGYILASGVGLVVVDVHLAMLEV